MVGRKQCNYPMWMSLRKTPELPTYNIADYAYFSYNAFGVFSKLSRNPVGSSKKPRVPRAGVKRRQVNKAGAVAEGVRP